MASTVATTAMVATTATTYDITTKRLFVMIREMLKKVIWTRTYEEIYSVLNVLMTLSGSIGVYYECVKGLISIDASRDSRIISDHLKLFAEKSCLYTLSYHDCDEAVMKGLDLLSTIKFWSIPIMRDLPQRFYRDAIKAMITMMLRRQFDGQYLGVVNGYEDTFHNAYKWNTDFYVKLREVMSWEEIAEYFGFTSYQRLEMYATDIDNSRYNKEHLSTGFNSVPPMCEKIFLEHTYRGYYRKPASCHTNVHYAITDVSKNNQGSYNLGFFNLCLQRCKYRFWDTVLPNNITKNTIMCACVIDTEYYHRLYYIMALKNKAVLDDLIAIIYQYAMI